MSKLGARYAVACPIREGAHSSIVLRHILNYTLAQDAIFDAGCNQVYILHACNQALCGMHIILMDSICKAQGNHWNFGMLPHKTS